MDENDDIYIRRVEGDGGVYEYRAYSGRPAVSWKARLFFWSVLVGGIALGTVLFLFFLTFFVYVFLPIFLITSLWAAFKCRRFWRSR